MKLKQIIDGFSSPNPLVNAKALDWMCLKIKEYLPNSSELDLLELYCGNGNHTVALAYLFRHIVAVELNGLLCEIAHENLEANGSINNVDIIGISSHKFTKSLLKKRCFETIDGQLYRFDAVLVDPPRAGLDEYTREAVCNYDCIFYISCCMDALDRDLETVCV